MPMKHKECYGAIVTNEKVIKRFFVENLDDGGMFDSGNMVDENPTNDLVEFECLLCNKIVTIDDMFHIE